MTRPTKPGRSLADSANASGQRAAAANPERTDAPERPGAAPAAPPQPSAAPEFFALAGEVGRERAADVILYSGALKEGADDVVIQEARRRGRAENVILVICTLGGAADPAYRIARFLRNRYKHFTVLVHGFCKSAGTLLALGADELAMSDLAELGPLDVQLRKQDEYEVSSGLAVTAALTALEQQAFEAFKSHFMRTKVELGLSTRLASDIATNLAVGLFKEMYAQLDPVRLGEIARAVRIAADYGERLTDPSRCNPKPGTLDRLVTKYPAHRFVIDRREAAELFAKVRYPSATELRFIEHVDFATRTPLASDAQDPIVLFFPQPA